MHNSETDAPDADCTLNPVVRCAKIVGDPIGRGTAKFKYDVSEPQIWEQKLGTMDRTGLCAECDAAIYRAGVNLYHADAGGFYLLTPNAGIEFPERSGGKLQ